ncbi:MULTISPECIES: DUF3379 domain-containing protein [Vibrio]|uniref:DUF3379 domain-containing protein n=1 Tax=Vibrio TaxID=662 RepID=UPI000B8E7937|nr:MULTISPECIES: DUF3379 domain-containing protein [Vibrio]MBF4335976.1 DUF3379 domain-containing protein [Vibrio anguillarum]MBY7666185.1 DUF3379 domain-containing protein [Vibrio anguillarum]NAW89715.1 DUF3379 family protein [Vibrio sp. V24_P1S3T111]NAX44273.1 DUF3379 family protein [Vibrio sp. V25_P4S6T154]OXX22833.1 chemotaxis protein [Vibrio sp. V05_P4A8T149]
MDELEFRRRVMSDPKQHDQEIIQAVSTSDTNRQFLEDILSLDATIATAMNVDVPDDLADRILFSQTTMASNVIRPTFAKQAMTLAASIAFVFGLLVGQINWRNVLIPPAQASLMDTAIKHVIDEEGFVNQLDEQVNSTQINAKMLPFAYQLSSNFPYHVYYLNHCGFGKANALHMVFQGESGKVTLFFTGIASEQAVNFNEQGMAGIIEPVGDASLILVGENGEDVTNIAKKLMPMLKPSH